MNDSLTSFSATAGHRIVLVTFSDMMLLDFAGPAQVFKAATACDKTPHAYEIVVVSLQGGSVMTDLGITISTTSCHDLIPSKRDTLMVIGGSGAWMASRNAEFLDWLRAFAKDAGRVASVCLGAVILAAAGLLDGRRATTHWRYCDLLQRGFPQIRVEREPIFIQDGTVWTSAGVTAGIDLALAMVEDDLGHTAAVQVAQSLVVFLKRPGGQAQFSATLAAQSEGRDGQFAALYAWMAENIAADLRVECLAEHMGMSPRTFARAFTARTGHTPAKIVESLRVESARRMLESESDLVSQVAVRCGFGDDERMRRAFLRHLGTSPTDYRARFGSTTTLRADVGADCYSRWKLLSTSLYGL